MAARSQGAQGLNLGEATHPGAARAMETQPGALVRRVLFHGLKGWTPMPAIEKILFPVDFSRHSDGAAPFVRAMAEATQAEVTLFHALDAADYLFQSGELGGYMVNEFYQFHKDKSQKQLDEYRKADFPNAVRKLCEGDPGRRIVAYAHSNDIDLIMLPTQGLGPFRRYLIGSTTAKVLHDAHCPVWTGVHLDEAPTAATGGAPLKPTNILCAVDLSAQADAALRWAADLAERTGAKLTIAHAVPTTEARPAKYFDQEFHAELRRQAAFEIGKLQERVKTNAELVLVEGEPAKALRHAAVERHVDLLVIARGSAAEGFGRLRKHSYEIIRNAPCPTVSV